LALLEPPLDLLATLPQQFRCRGVEFGKYRDLLRLNGPAFVKPADALRKLFDAGIYANVRDIRAPRAVAPDTPVLVAEPVEWSAEFRCFILEGKAVAVSPYLSFGRPVWRPFAPGSQEAKASPSVLAFCDRLLARKEVAFPPAFVMDVGLIEDRGWAVVEFNPVWCSGVLGADPKQVLAALRRACQDARMVTKADRRWIVPRTRLQDQ
jgi:hypothetical protein